MTDSKHITVICDSREERCGIPQLLRTLDDVTVETVDLLSGDYVIGTLGIERKTAADFVNSILDNRLMEQCARMKTEFETSLIIIEGDVYKSGHAIDPKSLDGALSWLALLSGISILNTGNSIRTGMLIQRLGIHHIHGLGYEVPLRSGKPKDRTLCHQFLLEGLPGVGPGTAKKLLDHFKSPASVFKATEKDLLTVKGIGPSLAKKIFETVNC